jgi:hypothetical protein
MIASSSRAPDSAVSTTSARHSRVKSSTTARMRMRQLLISVSLTKSRPPALVRPLR